MSSSSMAASAAAAAADDVDDRRRSRRMGGGERGAEHAGIRLHVRNSTQLFMLGAAKSVGALASQLNRPHLHLSCD